MVFLAGLITIQTPLTGWADVNVNLIAWADVDINIIAQIESGNNPNAYNPKSGAKGVCQITPIVLEDFKNYCPHYSDDWRRQLGFDTDMYNSVTNKLIGDWYINERIPQMLRTYHIPDTIDNRLWAYNAGIERVRKGIMPQETKRYIEKYHSLKRR